MSTRGWKYDPVNDHFKTSDLTLKFACNCGAEFAPAGMKKCQCGKTYASFEIVPQDKTAASIVRVVRPVAEHRERILAKMAARFADNHDDSENYRDPQSKEQESERSETVDIPNKYTEGLTPNSASPFFVRSNPEEDAAPTILEKESSMTQPGQPRHLAPEEGAPRHLDPSQPSGSQWKPTTAPGATLHSPQGTGVAMPTGPGEWQGRSLQNGNIGTTPTLPNQQQAQNEVENQLVDPNLPGGRHRASKGTHMEFNEEDFKLGWAHASNDGTLPRTASKSFLEGYIAQLEEKTADRAPGWDTVAPAFAPPTPGLNNTMADPEYTNLEHKDLSAETQSMRNDLANKLDGDNASGKARGNGSFTDLSGWGKNSKWDLSQVHTAALAQEIAKRAQAEDPKA